MNQNGPPPSLETGLRVEDESRTSSGAVRSDERSSAPISDTVGLVYTSPAKAAWLDGISKDVDRQSKGRTERHDGEVSWH